MRNELGIREDEVIVGTAGKLAKGKGVFELLRAFHVISQRHPKIKLVFVGEGGERHKLLEEAERLSIDKKVILTGLRRDTERMYAAMDIFVLPSTCREAFGMVMIEAMAMGKPVIATNVGGIPEVIDNGINGILVPPGNADAIADAIARYIFNSEFSKKVAAEGRNKVEREFSDKVIGNHFEKVLKELS